MGSIVAQTRAQPTLDVETIGLKSVTRHTTFFEFSFNNVT